MTPLVRKALSATVILITVAVPTTVVQTVFPTAALAIRPGTCPVGGPNGIITASVSQPEDPYSNTPGIALPRSDPAYIPVSAVIAPGEGEMFAPITLVAVKAIPTAKVLRDGTLDPYHAVMDWRLRVNQFCPDTGQYETCEYYYQEMPDGRVFQVLTHPDGTMQEHAFRVECQRVRGFRAIGAPVDLGARLVAAARANIPPETFEATSAAVLGPVLFAAAGLPASAVPPEFSEWALVLAAAVGVAAVAAGPCGAALTSLLASEAVVWIQLLSIPGAAPGVRGAKAARAAVAKVAATVAFATQISVCRAQMAATPQFTALYEGLLALGHIFWWMSTFGMTIYGLDYAINYWL